MDARKKNISVLTHKTWDPIVEKKFLFLKAMKL
jgi:hypothetical protein